MQKNQVIPQSMKAWVLEGPGKDLTLHSLPTPSLQPGQLLIALEAASLNHRDLWITKGKYHQMSYPVVPGSDGAGEVVAVASDENQAWLGKKVLINPSLNWGPDRSGQGPDFQILGMPSQGTLAEYIAIDRENVYPLPEGYDSCHASALPLAGLTAFRALFYRGGLIAGQKLLITGIGGGVASYLLLFGIRSGAQVYVSSSSQEKIDKALRLGALGGVNYQGENWASQLGALVPGGFDLIVDSAGGDNFESLIRLLRVGGRLVNFGGTAGTLPPMVPASIFFRQASILGTTMGSPHDFESMLEFVSENNIRPLISRVFGFEETPKAFAFMKDQQQFGKIVLKLR